MGDTSVADKFVVNDVTVVLLDPQSADQWRRATHFYNAAGVRCVSVPSGSNNLQPAHLQHVLKQVETPYVVMTYCSDFVFPEMLLAAQNVLGQSPDTQMVQGYALGYQPSRCEVKYYRLPQAAIVHGAMGARSRVAAFAGGNLQAWRAVIRLEALESALGFLPAGLAIDEGLVALSYALITSGVVQLVDCTSGLIEILPADSDLAGRDQVVADLARKLSQWDVDAQGFCADDEGYVLLRAFVDQTYLGGEADALFTSVWRQDASEPERVFKPRQYVELPYYNARVFADLTAVEFLLHAWPAGDAQVRALEGAWVQIQDLLKPQPHDTAQSVLGRLWQAYRLNPFDASVCRHLLESATSVGDGERASSVSAWLNRLTQLPAFDTDRLLKLTPSGKALAAIEEEVPDNATKEQIASHLGRHKNAEVTIVVLDAQEGNHELQRTFDSILVSGVQNFRIVVLKAGELPAITSPQDTLHFVKVSAQSKLSHLNQLMRDTSSEWLLLLEAGEVLCAGGFLRLQVELAAGPQCMAIAANEVQRDEEGLLFGIQRPGADLDLLRSRPDAMSKHWVVRRTAALEVGGYSEQYPDAFEFDLLLRLVERYGLECLAHMDSYLVIGHKPPAALKAGAIACLNRHLGELGYRGQVSDQGEGHLNIEFRHATTPLVSVLICVNDNFEQLPAMLDSVFQRTRYPRFEVLLVCENVAVAHCSLLAQGYATKVRIISAPQGVSQPEMLNLAASQAVGEYVVMLSNHCFVQTPTWLEVMLNHAERPEVGVVGARLVDGQGRITHSGYQFQQGGIVATPWQGFAAKDLNGELGMREVHKCQAVASECMMVRRAVFEHCGPLLSEGVASIDFCLRVALEGLLVLSLPEATLINEAITAPSREQTQVLSRAWPAAFNACNQDDASWFDYLDF
ncbi:glycosyltransferase [Pseudomonas sp. CJQ_7]|uniref:glycosyltransferase family 2 protein n=1 Tax=Pseudomonas sp. CJQ_7 TaxID=3367166 RepID=UPI00370C83FB